jgi:ribonuclease HI
MPHYVVLSTTVGGVHDSEAAATTAAAADKLAIVQAYLTPAVAAAAAARFSTPSAAGRAVHVVFTDGACTGNGSASAAAGVGVFWGDADPRNVARPVSGDLHTNNVAELQAIELAVDAALADETMDVRIVTDSLYAVNCLTVWGRGWARNGWVTSKGTPPLNMGLIRRIMDKLAAVSPRVTFHHVRGHVGIYGNEQADALARAGVLAFSPLPASSSE